MNRSSYLRICALLAAADVRHTDLIEFGRVSARKGPDALYQDVLRMRAQLYGSIREDRPREPHPVQDELAAKVERLLFSEAGLSKSQAVEKLASELRRRYPDVTIPPEAKKGFTAWVRKLAALVPESDLLHLATTLRNSFVHDRPHDWRLK
jgi:hypothetical protein